MILDRFRLFLILGLLGLSSLVRAYDSFIQPIELTQSRAFLPTIAEQANWVFSGIVSNEQNEHYAYFFQLQRVEKQFRVMTALFNSETKTLIFSDDSTSTIQDPRPYNWQIGHSFLRFNAINNSWVLGVKTKEKKGFNFKVDMISQLTNNPTSQELRKGIEMIAMQTGQLNGHIWLGGEDNVEEFVSARNVWFQQVWLTMKHETTPPLINLLCRFDDGSGFYSMNTPGPDATRGAVAAWYDANGFETTMSQFIALKQQDDGHWRIRVVLPKIDLTVLNVLKHDSLSAGFVSEPQHPGFCLLDEDALG